MDNNVTSIDPLRNAVPPHTLSSLDRYVERGLQPGGFLTAVLENKLFEAFSRADDINYRAMPDIVKYINSRLPGNCWGYDGVVSDYCQHIRDSQP